MAFPNLRTWSVVNGEGRPAQYLAPSPPEDAEVPNWMSMRNEADVKDNEKKQAYIDTPQIIYSEWPIAAGGIKAPLGSFNGTPPKVALIGAGLGNCVAALELAKAGADVTIFEATSAVGGRCNSISSKDAFDKQDVYEMGAMRFPPSEDLLYYYGEEFGFQFKGQFPDPGKVPTLVSYKGKMEMWNQNDPTCAVKDVRPGRDCSAPDGFFRVSKGFGALCEEGITVGKQEVFKGVNKLSAILRSESQATRMTVQAEWQKYIDEFDMTTFRDGLEKIFGSDHKWDVPGGEVWTQDDFDRFAGLGIGSGGFGAFYPLGFNTIMRIVANGLETDQMVCTKDDKPTGIRNLVDEIIKAATRLENPVKIKYNTYAGVSDSTPNSATVWYAGLGALTNANLDAASDAEPDDNSEGEVPETFANGISDWLPGGLPHWKLWKTAKFDYVLVGTTNKVAARNNVISEKVTPQSIRDALEVHIVASSKLFIRTKKFWAEDPNMARVILSDGLVPQLYTLDYENPDYGVVLVDYAWEEASRKIEHLFGPALYTELFNDLKALFNDPDASWFQWLKNLGFPAAFDLNWIHWQSELSAPFLQPLTLGGWTLAKAGEDKKIQTLFFDFQKTTEKPGSDGWSPVLLNGDCYGWIGGWTEGALQTALNNVSAIIKANGKLNADNKAPSTLLEGAKNTYQYRPSAQ